MLLKQCEIRFFFFSLVISPCSMFLDQISQAQNPRGKTTCLLCACARPQAQTSCVVQMDPIPIPGTTSEKDREETMNNGDLTLVGGLNPSEKY